LADCGGQFSLWAVSDPFMLGFGYPSTPEENKGCDK